VGSCWNHRVTTTPEEKRFVQEDSADNFFKQKAVTMRSNCTVSIATHSSVLPNVQIVSGAQWQWGGGGGAVPGALRPRRASDHPRLSSAELRMREAIPPRPHMHMSVYAVFANGKFPFLKWPTPCISYKVSLFTNKMHYLSKNTITRFLPWHVSTLVCHRQGGVLSLRTLETRAVSEVSLQLCYIYKNAVKCC
jgi:hypothetical protein